MEFQRISLGELLRQAALKWPRNEAVRFLDTTMTYRELDRQVDGFATALYALGLRKGDFAALLLPNSIQYVIGYYAAARLGAVVSGINTSSKPKEILYHLNLIKPKALICQDALYEEKLAPIIREVEIDILVGTNLADFAPFGKRALAKLLNRIPSGKIDSVAHKFTDLLKAPINPPRVEIDSLAHPATCVLTAGATGTPRPVMLTHFNCVSNALQCRAWLHESKAGDGNIGILPLFKAFAMTVVMNVSIAGGGKMILFPEPSSVEDLVPVFTEAGPSSLNMAGNEMLYGKLTDCLDNGSNHKLKGKLQLCISGGIGLQKHVRESFEAVSGARIAEGYGLTEMSPVVSVEQFRPDSESRGGTLGLPLPSTEWKIVNETDPSIDLGTGESAEDSDHIGEIAVTGPQIMKEYLNRRDYTEEVIKEQEGKRWLLTGDMGFMDQSGRVVFMDRKKQLIRLNGTRVFPKEVEAFLCTHPEIVEAAAAGLPDEKNGELIKAWVVLKEGSDAGKEDLLSWAAKNGAPHMVPGHVEIRRELPKSQSGKILRRMLQEEDPVWKAAQGKNPFPGKSPA